MGGVWRWLVRTFLPPEHDDDWVLIPWQPLLFAATWVGALILLVVGDFANVPAETSDLNHGGAQYIWLALSLVCPPIGLWSLHMIRTGSGMTRYKGMWIRLGADLGQFTALATYLIARAVGGDYRVYPSVIFAAATVFTALLVYRDVRSLVRTERLAAQIERELHRAGQ